MVNSHKVLKSSYRKTSPRRPLWNRHKLRVNGFAVCQKPLDKNEQLKRNECLLSVKRGMCSSLYCNMIATSNTIIQLTSTINKTFTSDKRQSNRYSLRAIGNSCERRKAFTAIDVISQTSLHATLGNWKYAMKSKAVSFFLDAIPIYIFDTPRQRQISTGNEEGSPLRLLSRNEYK